MSAPIDVLFTQRMLSAAGLYTGKLDGLWGPLSNKASDAFDAFYEKTAVDLGRFDPRTEAVIHTLLPIAQVAARKFMIAARNKFTVKLLSGTRTYAEQDRLYEQGRTTSGKVVTNARGGQSNHNWSIAFDVGIFDSFGHYLTGANAKEEQAYIDLAKIAKAAVPSLEWGGDWKSKDRPHYQLATGKTVFQVRALFEAGKPYV